MNGNQVPTMARENSGVSARLRTYASQRGYTLQRAVNGSSTGTTLDLDHHAMGPADKLDGYWVGGATPAHVIPLPSDVRPYVRAFSAIYTAQNGHGFVGVWKESPDAPNAIVEGVQWVETLDAAETLARARGEIAIYDIANQKDLTV